MKSMKFMNAKWILNKHNNDGVFLNNICVDVDGFIRYSAGCENGKSIDAVFCLMILITLLIF